ncbi:S-layer homology domain-containing protein [Paenibacillus mendelii]|uniref:S-layer homology domain-containing protein n=1 Tax=Paenibacillus mendelii TaxID=206163 RepID=A0ABV6J3R3_9BACL|nr:S-layer homology domain-containing protein [Paenibacillus mendelii]MCQ6559292.1 S-layer homology domain-containing protein [Paenibacillus mendelii]
MKKRSLLIACSLILSLMVQSIVFAEPAPASAQPELEVKSARAYAGNTSTVDIVLNHPKGLQTFEFQLEYDHAALELSNETAVKGKDVADWLYQYKVDPVHGTVRVAAVNSTGFQTDESAVIMSMTFKAKGTAGIKTYIITDLKGFIDIHTPADITSKTGTFEIMSSGVIMNPTPEEPTDKLKEKIILHPIVDSNGHAAASVDDKDIAAVILNDKSGSVTIKVDVPTSAASVEVGFGKTSVDRMAASDKKLVIHTPIGDIALDKAMLTQVGGKDLVIKIEKAADVDHKPARTLTIVADGKPIAVFNGVIKISIPYVEETTETSENIVVYRLDGNKKVIIPQTIVIDGKVVFVTQQASTFAIGYNPKGFTDSTGHWAKNDIDFVTARELFLGVADRTFAPNKTMTRGMLITVLGRLDKSETDGQTPGFTDVHTGKYYAPYIAWANDNGIVKGTGNGRFAPEKAVTREEMALMIASYAKYSKMTLVQTSVERKFADEAEISSWALPAIKAMQTSGVLTGKPDNKFDPKGTATRAEIAKVIRMMIDQTVQ